MVAPIDRPRVGLPYAKASALAASLGRGDDLLAWHALVAGRDDDPAWHGYDALLTDDSLLDDWLDEVAERFAAPPRTAASYLLGWVTTGLAAAGAALLVAERRVPVLDARSTWLRRTAGQWVDATALDPQLTRLAVLGDDPIATADGVDVVDTVDDLRRRYIEGLTTQVSGFVEAIGRRSRLGRRVRWTLVADAVADTIVEVGRGLNDPLLGRDEADAVFAVAPAALGAPTWVVVRHGGADHVFCRRGACCLAYTTPTSSYCTLCPITTDDERERRIGEYLDRVRATQPLSEEQR